MALRWFHLRNSRILVLFRELDVYSIKAFWRSVKTIPSDSLSSNSAKTLSVKNTVESLYPPYRDTIKHHIP